MRQLKHTDKQYVKRIVTQDRIFENDKSPEGFACFYRSLFDFDYAQPLTEGEYKIRLEIDNANRNSRSDDHYNTFITDDEIEYAQSLLKTRKAPGPDEIVNEHILHGGKPVIDCLKVLFNCV